MRCYHALKSLKYEKVLCVIKDLTDTEALDISFSENMQRDNLNPIEQAKMYLKRMELGFDGNVFAMESKSKIPTQASFFVEKLSNLCNLIKK